MSLTYFKNGEPDYFGSDTESLNGHMREIIDALRWQQNDNPLVSNELREVTEELNRAAVRFTNTYYRSINPREEGE